MILEPVPVCSFCDGTRENRALIMYDIVRRVGVCDVCIKLFDAQVDAHAALLSTDTRMMAKN